MLLHQRDLLLYMALAVTWKVEGVEGLSDSLPDEMQPGPVKDDPWKGQFGGEAEHDDRRLRASIVGLRDNSGYCAVRLSVVSIRPKEKPLKGRVRFYLHNSFQNPKPEVVAVDGEAHLSFTSWGAFTVGILADGGATRLELDLADDPQASEPWKSR